MPVITAAAAAATAIAGAIGFSAAAATFIGSVAAFAARTLLTIGISKLIANRSNSKAAGSQDAGSRIQLPPSTDNKLPVIYGKAFISGTVTDAKLSTDQTTMWYVLALAEHTDTTSGSGYTFGSIYIDNKLVTFDGTDPAKVISLTTNTAGGGQVDTKINGNLFIYLFTNGSTSGVNTGGQSAITILSDSAIPSDIRWNSTLYTANGQSADMTNTCFAIVKMIYNEQAGTTNIPNLTFELTNSLDEPGSVILDYLQNTRYGCAIPASRIDTASLAALDAYSNSTITYIPVGGGSATQARYKINGPINTGLDCLTNLQTMVDACDSWLQYSEMTGQWKVVINRSYTDTTSTSALFSVDSDNLIGGIEVNPIDLNSTYNEMEVQYPNENIKDQTDFQVVSLFTSYPSLLSPNEAINRLTIQLPIVNNAVQAKYLGLRRLLQGREDLVISFATDYSGIQVEAGDVIKVTLSQYGWTDKLFRVNYVGEEKYPDGSLGARMTAFEYNDTIYADNSIQDFIPADNTGLIDPNVITAPLCPQVTMDLANTIATMTVEATIPTVGQIMYMDFKYGNTSNVQQHLLYSTVSGNGEPLTANSNVSITVTDLPAGNWWWSVVAKNNQVGVPSNSCPNISNVSNWPGPVVTEWDSNSNTGGITNNNIANSAVTDSKIANNTITGGKIANNTITGGKIANYTITSNNLSNTGVVSGNYSYANIQVGLDGRVINISNGSGGGTVLIKEDGANIVNANTINFIGNTITASLGGSGQANVTVNNLPDIVYMGHNGYGPYELTQSPTTNVFSRLHTGACRIPGGQASYANGNVYSYSLSSTDLNPWYSNTASTANGFFANSTSAFQPGDARYQSIYNSYLYLINGWAPFARDLVANVSQVFCMGSMNIIADYDCNVQFGGAFGIYDANIGFDEFVDYSTVETIPLVANQGKNINLFFKISPNNINANTELESVCMVLRAPESGGNVYITQNQLWINRGDGWTFNDS